ncbi:peptidase G1 [Halenospora varia]|nr:peptidase G1 [Halenospora varia]
MTFCYGHRISLPIRRQNQPWRCSTPPFRPGTVHLPTDDSPYQYTYNWGGAVMKPPPANESYTSVSGLVAVPVPSLPPNATAGVTYKASVWLGLGGTVHNTGLWQAGFYVTAYKPAVGNTIFSYLHWFEWFPEAGRDIPLSSFPLQASDIIALNITARSPISGTAVFENYTNGRQFVIDMTVPNEDKYRLRGRSAEWIVEDFTHNGEMVSLVDWKIVRFWDCKADTNRKKGMQWDGAMRHIIVSEQNKQRMNVTILSKDEVQIEYMPAV